MNNEQAVVPASIYLAWWQALAERLAAQPDDKGLGTLLWQLDVIGRANEVMKLRSAREVVGTTGGPGLYVVSTMPDADFDWDGTTVTFAHPGYLTIEPEVLIHDLIKVTGIEVPA